MIPKDLKTQIQATNRSEIRKIQQAGKRNVRIEAKRAVELWIYSFADMYLILVCFFIALSAIYVSKISKQPKIIAQPKPAESMPSAGRGPAVAESLATVSFETGTDDLTEQGIASLKDLLPLIRSNSKALLDIEGYADSADLASGSAFNSKLKLSNSRAIKVAEWFLSKGIPASRIRTFSYGDGYQYSGEGKKVKTDRRVLVKFFLRSDV
jgi:outer membrane protein OmpA-like peptidoglycan-associated protein